MGSVTQFENQQGATCNKGYEQLA